MLNSISIMGRFVNDPELRVTAQKQAHVCTFTIANERDIKGADGKYPVDFIEVNAWNATADFVAKYFHKGDLVVMEGRLTTNRWEDKEGNKRTSYQINADKVYFAGGKNANADSKASEPTPNFSEIDDADGDLPF